MDSQKINHFKEKLEAEMALVINELKHVGQKNPSNPTDWEGKPADFDTDRADDSEVADKIEEYEENTAVLKNLEIKLNEIKIALNKIETNKYGICEIGGELIEKDRLVANPAAKTCKAHM